MTAGAPDLVRLEGVTRVLPGVVPVTLVRDIDLAIGAGEFIAITGPSGSGKSSLLYLLGLLDRPTRGRVMFDGLDTGTFDDDARAQLRLERLGFVFQFHFLLEEFSVLDNVLIPMRRLGRLDTATQRRTALRILDELDIADQAAKRPVQLSGGQRQRVAVARALANDPPLILADEPTGNLDSVNAQRVFDIFARLVSERGKTIVTVTHDPDLAATAPRQVRTLDGRIVAEADAVA
jgi:lipoprotein-releasing system ATP-binding protein